VVFAKLHRAVELPVEPRAAPAPEPTKPALPRSTLVNRLALPGAFALAWLVAHNGWARFAMQATFAMEIHELGHASLLWLGSRWAVPLPMFTLNLSEHRSVIVFALITGSLGFVGRRAWQQGSRGVALWCAGIVGLQLLVTLLPDRTFDLLVQFAGVGGEFYLSAILVVAFYYRFPADLRWDRARWFFLAIGACTFALNTQRWWLARRNAEAIPWGSFFGGDGDMDHLRDQFGWTPAHLVSVYLWVGGLSAAVIACHYLYFAWLDVTRAPRLSEI
jgi:hypothetical protein